VSNMGRIFLRHTLSRFPQVPASVFWVFVLLFFVSLRVSIFLQINEYLLIGFFSVLFYFIGKTKAIFQQNRVTLLTAILFLLSAFLGQRGNLNGYIGIAIMSLPLFVVLMAKSELKMALLQRLNKFLAALVAISLFAFFIHLIGVPLPHRTYEWKSYVFNDYTFFVIIPSLFYALERFQFVFTEPGYFGCLMAFMIFLNKYDFKKCEVWIFLIALVFTYSLAGYILFFFGLTPFIMQNSKSKFKYLFILVFLLGGFFYLNGASEENFVTKMFSYRLQIEDGNLTGYNRTSDRFEYWYSNSFVNSGKWLFGANEEIEQLYAGSDELIGVDLRAYIARYGIIPLFFYFGSMLYFYRKNRTKFGLWYFLLFALFYYRGYTVMYYIGFPIIYYLGIQMFKLEYDTGKRIL